MNSKDKKKKKHKKPIIKSNIVKKQPVMQSISITEAYSGPIHHPKQFKQYELILPGYADRILKMAESQALHRQDLEKTVVFSGAKDSKRGQIFAFIIAITIVIGGVVSITMGRDVSGYGMLFTAIVPLGGAFVIGKKSEKDERIAKDKQSKQNQ